MAKDYDPLKCIPSSDAVRKRLDALREQARRLGILLKTAEELEQGKAGDSDASTEVDQ